MSRNEFISKKPRLIRGFFVYKETMKTSHHHLSTANLTAITALAVTLPLYALQLDSNFQNGAMFQAGKPIEIYGLSTVTNEDVKISFGETVISVRSDESRRFTAVLPPMKPCKEGRDLIAEGTENSPYRVAKVTDILVGEIWFASGQSNMSYVFSSFNARKFGGPEAVAEAKTLPPIRMARIGSAYAETPPDFCPIRWADSRSDDVKTWSAVAFAFAARIAHELDCPVGIIENAVGGEAIEPYITPWGFMNTPGCEKYVSFLRSLDPSTDEGQIAFADANARIDNWQERMTALAENGKRINEPVPTLPSHSQIHNLTLRAISMSRLARWKIRGFLWYQGSSNVNDFDYTVKVKALANGWRHAWGDDTLPFYIVQLAPLDQRQKDDDPKGGDGTASLREQQRIAYNEIKYSGLACIIDVGEDRDIHPRNKKDVGERLAVWALNRDYGRNNVVPSGPMFREAKTEGNRIRCYFDFAEGGLITAKKNNIAPIPAEPTPDIAPGGFAIAGDDHVWQWAEAEFDGETVILSSEKVAAPKYVRYAYAANPMGRANVYNKSLLPMVPFRTDPVSKRKIRYASWNIGHFALGKNSESVITPETVTEKGEKYREFLSEVGADYIGVCEYSDSFTSNGIFKASQEVFTSYDANHIGPQNNYQCNAAFWNKNLKKVREWRKDFPQHNQKVYYIATAFDLDGTEVVFVQTHLDWQTFLPGHEQDRAKQMNTLLEDFKSTPRVVISGDFNIGLRIAGRKTIDAPSEYNVFRNRGYTLLNDGRYKTYPAGKCAYALDNILVKGFTISNITIGDRDDLSDHALIAADLVLE